MDVIDSCFTGYTGLNDVLAPSIIHKLAWLFSIKKNYSSILSKYLKIIIYKLNDNVFKLTNIQINCSYVVIWLFKNYILQTIHILRRFKWIVFNEHKKVIRPTLPYPTLPCPTPRASYP